MVQFIRRTIPLLIQLRTPWVPITSCPASMKLRVEVDIPPETIAHRIAIRVQKSMFREEGLLAFARFKQQTYSRISLKLRIIGRTFRLSAVFRQPSRRLERLP